MIWLIMLGFVLAGSVGYATGSLCTLLYGTATAVRFARRWLAAKGTGGRIDGRTNAWLDEVQARAERLCRCDDEDCVADVRKLADEDVPQLIAEVRRLACRTFELEQDLAAAFGNDEGDQNDDLCCADPANYVECRDGEPGDDSTPPDPFFESTYADPAVRAAIHAEISKAGR